MIKHNGNVMNVSLTGGRHDIPQATDGAIFNKWTPHSDNMVAMLYDKAKKRVYKIAREKEYLSHEGRLKDVHINLYVTGLTVALISVLNAMADEDVTISLWHWDKYKREFYKQDVI